MPSFKERLASRAASKKRDSQPTTKRVKKRGAEPRERVRSASSSSSEEEDDESDDDADSYAAFNQEYFSSLFEHEKMLADVRRMDFYHALITRHVAPGAVVRSRSFALLFLARAIRMTSHHPPRPRSLRRHSCVVQTNASA